MRIKVNYDKCAGCKACELACSARHYQVYSTKLTRINIVKFEDKVWIYPLFAGSASMLHA